jgi:two-component system CheB/CheR fusion protein
MNILPAPVNAEVQDLLWKYAATTNDHAVLLLDASGTVTWANAGAHLILNSPQDTLTGTPVGRFFSDRDAAWGIPSHELAEARQLGTASDDRWMIRADRTRFWASGLTIFLDSSRERFSYLKIFRDFTEMKMQLHTSREQQHIANLAQEEMAAALAVLAHELRNPLSAIGMASEVVERRVPEDARISNLTKAISSNVVLAARLIEDLLQHCKVNSKEFSLERSPGSLREQLESCTSIAKRQMGQDERPIAILVPSADITIFIDQLRMQQVFVNLIANAIRYTPPPGRIWVSATIEESEVIVRVTDEGVGIDAGKLDELFSLLTVPRIGDSKLGLGLGLALVKKIVELHGGSVQARSEGPGRGSQFIVRFPAGGQQMRVSP